MANSWLRLYAEFAADPKVQSMSEAMQRRLVMLMCLRCADSLATLDESEIAFALRVSDEELGATKQMFSAKGFIDSEWSLVNWDKRQFTSDSSTSRVKRYREQKRTVSETEPNEKRNVSVTSSNRFSNAPEQNRTDTEKNINPSVSTEALSALGEAIASADAEERGEAKTTKPPPYEKDFSEDWPKFWARINRGAAFREYQRARRRCPRDELMKAVMEQGPILLEQASKRPSGGVLHPATWLKNDRWADEVKKSVANLWGEQGD